MYRNTNYETYPEYLQSNEWREVKRKVLLKRRYCCAICQSLAFLQFHHLSYNRVGLKDEWKDIRIVCEKHHKKCHKILIRLPNNTRWIYYRYYQLRITYSLLNLIISIIKTIRPKKIRRYAIYINHKAP